MATYLSKELKGDRVFERICNWNVIDYTVISKRNRLAKYADDPNAGDRLNLTFFSIRGNKYAINQYAKLVDPIVLEDFTVLSRQDTERGEYYLAVNETKDRVRVYREVT